MTVDVTKLKFYSVYPIDKIVLSGQVSYLVTASTSSLQTIPNTYGTKLLVVASYSVDGVNFNSSHVILANLSANLAEINCGVSTSNIYFYIINGYGVNTTFTINYAVYSIS